MPLHRFRFDERTEEAGLERDAAYLVRPDGYVGAAAHGATSWEAIRRYLDEHGVWGR